MNETTFSPESAPREPSPEEISSYFFRVGLRFREQLKTLKDLEVFGKKAKQEGWFVGYHSVVEAVAVLKIAKSAGLSSENRKILAEAAMLHDSSKRKEVEGNIQGLEGMSLIHEESGAALRERGVDERTIVVIEATSPAFYKAVGRGDNVEHGGGGSIDLMRKIMAYIDNCTQTSMGVDSKGVKTQATKIVHWRERLEDARRRYPDLEAEKDVVGNKEYSHFDLEEIATKKLEDAILDSIKEHSPEDYERAAPNLPAFIQSRIYEDIINKRLPTL